MTHRTRSSPGSPSTDVLTDAAHDAVHDVVHDTTGRDALRTSSGLPLLPLERAILQTVIYADLFHFALTLPELHHFLIAESETSLAEIDAILAADGLSQHLCFSADGSLIALTGRESLFALRAEREQIADVLWQDARRCAIWLARLPFVRMVALTGALSMRNAASTRDDLDYFLITAPDRVWTARALSVLLVRVGRRFGVTICPNFIVAETQLAQTRHDLFIAHEVCQMIPLFGAALYLHMRAANRWTDDHMPNATAPFHPADDLTPTGFWAWLKRVGEWALGGSLGARFERWEYARKQRRFARLHRETPHSAAIVDAQQVKGHFHDHGHPVLTAYATRLGSYGL